MNTTNDKWDVKLEDAPTRKSGVPGWVWGCGGGCMLMLLLAIGVTWWFGAKIAGIVDPEKAWPEVAELMPYGAVGPDGVQADHTVGRPAGLTPLMLPVDNVLFRQFVSEEDIAALPVDFVLFLQPDSNPSLPVGTGVSLVAVVFRERVENPLTLVVESPVLEELLKGKDAATTRGVFEAQFQGRAVQAHHIAAEIGEANQQMVANSEGLEDLLFVDVTGERTRSVVFLMAATGDATGSIDELENLLAPFRVWEGK
jgi:hypothetical protein